MLGAGRWALCAELLVCAVQYSTLRKQHQAARVPWPVSRACPFRVVGSGCRLQHSTAPLYQYKSPLRESLHPQLYRDWYCGLVLYKVVQVDAFWLPSSVLSGHNRPRCVRSGPAIHDVPGVSRWPHIVKSMQDSASVEQSGALEHRLPSISTTLGQWNEP